MVGSSSLEVSFDFLEDDDASLVVLFLSFLVLGVLADFGGTIGSLITTVWGRAGTFLACSDGRGGVGRGMILVKSDLQIFALNG